MQGRLESNQLSRTAVRGLFTVRFGLLFFFSTPSSEVGAPTSNLEPDRSLRGSLLSSEQTTGSPE